ncbi:MAG: phycocyanin operon protein Z [Cyanobacteria bacterium M5B4]|nr:MAG: phycocyanin operon protein Z [Cyanobacteria bacterium M5B4]
MELSLFEQLRHPNPHLRDRAMAEIVANQDETTIPYLIGLLGEVDTTYRRAAVKTIGAIGYETVPFLAEALLHSEDVTVRGSAAKALAQVAVNFGDEGFPKVGIDALEAALQDLNPVVHIAAVMALGEIGAPVLDVLIGALQTTDNPALAVAIVGALGSIGDDRGVAVLNQLIEAETTDSYVKESAVSALSRLEMVQSRLTLKDR